jgi:AcrR family transcriptional regulator
MTRATKEAWCRAGIQILRTEGAERITVERLCERVTKTKGSFYHHFVDLDAYFNDLLRLWEHEHTERVIASAQAESGRKSRDERLETEVRKLDQQLELAVRAWAMRDDRARASLQKVDARRIEYLGSRHANEDDAVLEYAVFIGLQHLGVLNEPARAERLNLRMHQALEALASRPGTPGAAAGPSERARGSRGRAGLTKRRS